MKFYKKCIRLISNRLVLLFLVILLLNAILAQRLFQLQILEGKEYTDGITRTMERYMDIPATRGSIYDRYGRPLAVNIPAYSIRMNPSSSNGNLNEMILALLQLLEKNGETFLDEMPITKEDPFTFTFRNASQEKRWRADMGFEKEKLQYDADETIAYLREFFQVPSELSNSKARDLLSIRCSIYLQRYRQYHILTLASNVTQKTMLAIEEHKELFPGLFIKAEQLRYYPEKEYFSHILGYIRPISEEELESNQAYGYTSSDLFGKSGIEKSFEQVLSGKKGKKTVEVTSSGKLVSSIVTEYPTRGDHLYLTLDSQLQKKATMILIENLKKVLLKKLDSGEIPLKQLFVSMVKGNKLSIKSVLQAPEGTAQAAMKAVVLNEQPLLELQKSEDMDKAKSSLINAIQGGSVSLLQCVLSLLEQEILSCEDEKIVKLKKGQLSPLAFIKEKLNSGELSPSETNLDPCTGSLAVVDVNTGEILALVSYPSYDNNMLVNNFNQAYYAKLLDDPTTPMVNRPLMERKAPGSTLKMLSALAGLESGVITPTTRILDQGVFQSAGIPYANCLIYTRYGSTHGHTDVSKAIEVSCNYFFYEMAYRMGNATTGNTLNSIATFNEYMLKFGLGDYSGVEIEEYKPKMASPETKRSLELALNPNATEATLRWKDGDSIRSAIGQSVNSYSVIQMAKYIATLANGGQRYKLSLLHGTSQARDSMLQYKEPVLEKALSLNQKNLKAVYDGMLRVTRGSQGTLRSVFADFPIKVAGKTGTAEESNSRPSHTWFTGYAPYDNPQIAVVVMIPFGESTENPAPKIAKELFADCLGLTAEPQAPLLENALSQ